MPIIAIGYYMERTVQLDRELVIDIVSSNSMNDKNPRDAADSLGGAVPLLGGSGRIGAVEFRFGNRGRGLSQVANQTYYSTIQETFRLKVVRLLLSAWPILCIALIIARASNHLALPWLVVLAPIWLPILIATVLLLGAMWLDKLSSQIADE